MHLDEVRSPIPGLAYSETTYGPGYCGVWSDRMLIMATCNVYIEGSMHKLP